MVRNPIVVRVARATVFWWLLLTVVTFSSIDLLDRLDVRDVSLRIALAFAGVTAAIALIAAATRLRRELVRRSLLEGERRGITTSVGPVPEGLGQPQRIAGSRLDLERTHPLRLWADQVRDTHPEVHALFGAIVDTMAAYPDCPAAPVRTGHGGRTLFEHSLVVVEQVTLAAPKFRYDGGRNRQGKLVRPVLDSNFRFDPEDPLIVLLAFAHDIGKLECYQRDPASGRIEEIKRDHDRIGRLMLARMPELWQLAPADRQALLFASGYYHHPQALPEQVEDRPRALMELLIVADTLAGQHEDAHPVWGTTPPIAAVPLTGATSAAPTTAADMDEEDDNAVLPPVAPEHAGAGLDRLESYYAQAFLEVLALPRSINGPRGKTLGYRWDNLLYLEDEPLRHAMARQLDEASLMEAKHGDGRSRVNEDLMRALLKLGWLYNVHDGAEYSETRALFRVKWLTATTDASGAKVWERPDDKYTSKATIIVKVVPAIAHRVTPHDCRLKPLIEGPVFSTQSARNKKQRLAAGPAPAVADVSATEVQPVDVPAAGTSSETPDDDALDSLGDLAPRQEPVSAPEGVGAASESRGKTPPELQLTPQTPPALPADLPPIAGDAAGAALLALVEFGRRQEKKVAAPPAPVPSLHERVAGAEGADRPRDVRRRPLARAGDCGGRSRGACPAAGRPCR